MSDIRGIEGSARGEERQKAARNPNTVNEAVGSARERASRVYDNATVRVGGAWTATQRQASSRPFVTVASAAVVGAGLAWLLPSGKRETEVMAEVAQKVGDAARDAADTAVQAGRQQVDELAQNALASVGGAVVQAVMAGGNADTK
jgi:ElaB/YqjD/DUF883 family membrane-anchored ribosome-binding protein